MLMPSRVYAEIYEQQMDIVAKARKLEEVSGMSIDALIEYYTLMRNTLGPLAGRFEIANIMTSEEMRALLKLGKEEINVLCNRREGIEECLTPYINKPVYVKGYCWGLKFDGWVVLYYADIHPLADKKEMLFDYKGKTYPAFGFLPSRFTLPTDSSYGNAFYKEEE